MATRCVKRRSTPPSPQQTQHLFHPALESEEAGLNPYFPVARASAAMRHSQDLNYGRKLPIHDSEREPLQQKPARAAGTSWRTLRRIGNRRNSTPDLPRKSQSGPLPARKIPCERSFKLQARCFMEFDWLTFPASAVTKSGVGPRPTERF